MKKRLIQLLGIVLMLCFPVHSVGQIAYQYWIDNDTETAISGTTTASGDISLAIDMADQTPGIHFYNLRARDGKKWGPVYRYLFAIPREQQADVAHMITGYRYGFGDEMTAVTFDTPVSEYTLNQPFDVPEPPLPTIIDDDCHFSFSDDEATLLRNITMEFALTFTDESKAMSSPVGTSFTLADTRTSDIQTLEVAGSLPIEAHTQGGYTVVKFEIPAADNYTLTTTAASSLRLFSSIGATLTTIGSDDLTAGYAQDYEADTYYAVVFGNAEEVTLSLAGKGEPCGYAIFDSETGTLTFKYGIMPNGDNVWETENTTFTYRNPAPWATEALKKAVFDASYSEVRPTSTEYWFQSASNLTEITDMQYLNTSHVTAMTNMFFRCSSLTSLDVSHFDTGNVTTMYNMFRDCSSLTSLDLSQFNTGNVTSMGYMFSGCSSLTSLDVSHFDTSNVTSMSSMFCKCSKLTSLDVSHFDTGNVTYMADMFEGCSSLTSLDVSHFETGNVKGMTAMFEGCSSLTSLDVSHFETGNVSGISFMFHNCSSLTSLDVSHFDTSKETNMWSMFNGCSSLTSLDVSHFNTSNVTNMESMFYGCSSLTSLDISHFDTSNVTNMRSMFNGCSSLTSLDVSHFDTSNVKDMESMFYGCSSLTSLDVRHFDTRNVVSFGGHKIGDNFTGGGMFLGCENLTSLDLSSFNTAKVKFMRLMFLNCKKLETIYVGDGWTTENVTNSDNMFSGCIALVGCAGTVYDSNHTDVTYARVDGGNESPGYLSVKNYVPPVEIGYAILSENGTLTFKYGFMPKGDNVWETENTSTEIAQLDIWDCSVLENVVFDASYAEARPTSTAYWFSGAKHLKQVVGLEYLNTSNVTSMAFMFSGCQLLSSLDVTHFDTSNVTDMAGMFSLGGAVPTTYTTKLTILDVSHFDTSNVTNMNAMFSYCTSLTSLDVSHFDTGNVTNMAGMFCYCSGLTSLDVTNFDTSKVTDMASMFLGCGSLTSLDVTNFDTRNVVLLGSPQISDDTYYYDRYGMFQGCEKLTSLDLSSFNTANVESMGAMFDNCRRLQRIYVSEGWTTENVSYSDHMFTYCFTLVGGKGTKYDANYVDKNYAHIDGGEGNPGYLTRSEEETDYAIFDSETGTLTFKYGVKPEGENVYPTIYDMAEYKKIYGDGFISPWHPIYKELKTVIFDESYSIVRPKSLYSWFIGALHLNEINGLEYLNTSEVENMSNLFGDCSSLTELDLSHFNTGNVTDMSGMFSGCSNLKTIIVGDQWSTASVTDGRYMFYDCTSLVGSAGTKYDSGHIDHAYAHIDGGTRNPGYFSQRIDVNGDNVLDAKDIVDLIDFIAGKSPKDVTKDSADVNGDGKVDIADVIMVASATLSK